MRAYVENQPWRDTVDVYVISGESSQGDRYAAVAGPGLGEIEWRPVPFGALPPPFARWERGMLVAIGAAIADEIGPPPSTGDAIDDARKTRDRLLALVEKAWEERP